MYVWLTDAISVFKLWRMVLAKDNAQNAQTGGLVVELHAFKLHAQLENTLPSMENAKHVLVPFHEIKGPVMQSSY